MSGSRPDRITNISIISYISMDCKSFLLDFFDFISNSVLMPIAALFTAIFVGYVIKPQAIIEEAELSGRFRMKKLFVVMIKYVAPVCLLVILISSILSAMGIITI